MSGTDPKRGDLDDGMTNESESTEPMDKLSTRA